MQRVRADPHGHNSAHLARYQANLAVCLRDRGENEAATAAIRGATQILKINQLDPAMTGAAGRQSVELSTDQASAWIRGVVDGDTDLAYSNAWITRQIVESGGFPGAVGFLEQYVAVAMALHPGGTPTLADRFEDLAMLNLRSGNAAEASSAFARAIELRRSLRGRYGMMASIAR